MHVVVQFCLHLQLCYLKLWLKMRWRMTWGGKTILQLSVKPTESHWWAAAAFASVVASLYLLHLCGHKRRNALFPSTLLLRLITSPPSGTQLECRNQIPTDWNCFIYLLHLLESFKFLKPCLEKVWVSLKCKNVFIALCFVFIALCLVSLDDFQFELL